MLAAAPADWLCPTPHLVALGTLNAHELSIQLTEMALAKRIHRAAIYRLDGDAVPDCLASVEIPAGPIDGVTETDGLAVTSAALPGHPDGILIIMDDQNAGYTTNFKVIDWAAIAAMLP